MPKSPTYSTCLRNVIELTDDEDASEHDGIKTASDPDNESEEMVVDNMLVLEYNIMLYPSLQIYFLTIKFQTEPFSVHHCAVHPHQKWMTLYSHLRPSVNLADALSSTVYLYRPFLKA